MIWLRRLTQHKRNANAFAYTDIVRRNVGQNFFGV